MTIGKSVCSEYSVINEATVNRCLVYIIVQKFAPNKWVSELLSESMGSELYTIPPRFAEACIYK